MKLILGLGITGLSVARFFFKKDISFRIADSRQEPPMLDIAEKESVLSDSHFGEWSESLLEGVTEIIISPGISETESIVDWSRQQSVPIISDIELFGRYTKTPIIGLSLIHI